MALHNRTLNLTVFALLRPPSRARLYVQDEIARFAPTLRPGLVQLAGEVFLIAAVVYVARRWLKVGL